MGTTEKPKRKQIILTAKALFWKYGIKRVTVEEICREARVSKMTFYKYFNNKMELARSILEKLTSDALNEYKDFMDADIPFTDKVKKSITLKIEYTNAMSPEFFADLYNDNNPEIVNFFNQKVQENIQIVTNDYVEAQKKGDIRSDIKPAFILYFLNHLLDMAKDENLLQLYDSPQDLIMELTNFFFYGVLPRDKK